MAMALSYLDDLSRVRIALSALTDGTVRVERSANATGGPWTMVRGATELPIVGGVGQVDDYEFYADVENFYRVIRLDPLPPQGLQLTGVAGAYASTPDDPTLDITGDIDIRVDVELDDWTPPVDASVMVAKWLGPSDLSYRVRINFSPTSGSPQFAWDNDGVSPGFSTTGSPFGTLDGTRQVFRVTFDIDNGSGQRVATFYTGDSINGPWTQTSQNTVGGVASIFAGAAALEVGSSDGGTVGMFSGLVHAVQVRDGINGTVVAYPVFDDQAAGTLNFVDAAGRTWTVNGAASIVDSSTIIEEDSITPDLDGVTWLKSIKYPALNTPILGPNYRPIQRAARTGIYNIKGRVPPTAVHDAWTEQWWTIETSTLSLADARKLDLSVIAAGTYFIHVPAEFENECLTNPVSGMPGGYVAILNSTQTHAVDGSHAFEWIFYVRVVTPPAPEIYGTTLNWVTVKRLYGSWEALWASNATWRDVWATIMDEEDAVVL